MLVILSHPTAPAKASLLRYSICKQNSNSVIYHLSLCAALSFTASSPRPPGHARCILLAQRQADRECFFTTFSAPMHSMMRNSCPCSCFDTALLHEFLEFCLGVKARQRFQTASSIYRLERRVKRERLNSREGTDIRR
jgi:hypothetical protein